MTVMPGGTIDVGDVEDGVRQGVTAVEATVESRSMTPKGTLDKSLVTDVAETDVATAIPVGVMVVSHVILVKGTEI